MCMYQRQNVAVKKEVVVHRSESIAVQQVKNGNGNIDGMTDIDNYRYMRTVSMNMYTI